MTKAEKTKQFIIEKTAPVFNTKGYAGTSITDITEATGLTKGSVYGNFTNKDEVALAAFDHNLKTVNDIINREIKKQGTIKEKLLVYVEVYENYVKYPFPIGGCPILNTAIEADDTHEALKKKASGAIISWKKTVASLIKHGIENKEFSAGNDPEQIALSIIALVEGATMIARVTGKPNYRNAILKSVEKIITGLN